MFLALDGCFVFLVIFILFLIYLEVFKRLWEIEQRIICSRNKYIYLLVLEEKLVMFFNNEDLYSFPPVLCHTTLPPSSLGKTLGGEAVRRRDLNQQIISVSLAERHLWL